MSLFRVIGLNTILQIVIMLVILNKCLILLLFVGQGYSDVSYIHFSCSYVLSMLWPVYWSVLQHFSRMEFTTYDIIAELKDVHILKSFLCSYKTQWNCTNIIYDPKNINGSELLELKSCPLVWWDIPWLFPNVVDMTAGHLDRIFQ